MKKLTVLLVTAVLALSASAGVNNRIVNTKTTKVNVKELKAKAATQRESLSFKRNGETTIAPVQLKSMDWQARPASHMLKAENDIVWDFEGETATEGWMALDNDGDGYGWEYVDNTNLETGRFDCHSGEGVMVSASFDNDMAMPLYPDNWLISPVVNLKNTLYFYAEGQDANYAAEKFAVYVCVGTPTSINDFVKVGTDKTATGDWKQYVYDLSEYAGQEGCFAIRHYNVTDMFYLNVDDVTLTDEEIEPEPEPETPDLITELPAGCADFKFMRSGVCLYSSYFFGIGMTDIDGDLIVAFNEDATKAYIQNPIWWFDSYGTWVEGDFDLNTGIITVPTGQYLTWSDSYGYGIQLMWGSSYIYSDVDEDGEEGYYLGTELDERAEEIQFQVSPDFKYIDLLNCESDLDAEFPLNYEVTGLYAIYSDDLGWAGALEFTEEGQHMGEYLEIKPVQPANPTADEWYDCGDESGFSKFYFTLPRVDVNGDALDPSLISYKIYTDDDQLFTFPAEDYTYDLYEDIDEVDYDLYSSAVDFHDYFCYFYRTNAEGFDPFFTWRIGIQAIYNVNGEAFPSDIVYLEVFPKEEPQPAENVTLVLVDQDGVEHAVELTKGEDGDFSTTVTLDYVPYGQFYWDPNNTTEENEANRPNVPFYFLIDGQRYGVEGDVAAVLGYAMANPLDGEADGFYTVPVGFSYTLGVAFKDGVYYVYAAVSTPTGVDELNANKTVANVRYFNVMGQEMAQPEGMTIAVTTYTDGTTSTVKVVK